MRKVHKLVSTLIDPDCWGLGDTELWHHGVLCKHPGWGKIAVWKKKVTCKRCLKIMEGKQ